jgi:hypothetical protein
MDKNKEQKLMTIGYTIQPCCGLCAYAKLSADGWGTCKQHTYQHDKHTGVHRQVSINQYGLCTRFLADTATLSGKFKHFERFKSPRLDTHTRVALP